MTKNKSPISKITLNKLIRSPWRRDDTPMHTHFAPCDQTSCAIATSRATFWTERIDPEILEKSLVIVAEDLPFIAGRIVPVTSTVSWKMGDICVANNNTGIELQVIEAKTATLDSLGPDSWPMKSVTINTPKLPFYIPHIDTTPKKLLFGNEPLCKVQLTQVADGCVLAITLSHIITDGMHWPLFMMHVAARYRQMVTGMPANPSELIPSECRDGLSLEKLKARMKGGNDWKPRPFEITPSVMDYIRTAGLLWSNGTARMQLEIVFIPKERISQLKTAASEGCDQPITTGDIVQALAAMLIHIAEGKPILPIHPKCMIALIQIPGIQEGHFGNAVHPMAVGVPENTKLTNKDGDFLGALRLLASQIRSCTTEIRSDPGKALQAVYESSQVCNAPILKALAYLAGHRLPYVTATTNYIGSLPADAALDFHLPNGSRAIGYRSLTTPLARSMAVIRPSMRPYGDGLFFQLSVTQLQARRLKGTPLLNSLAPDAVFLGAKKK